MASRERSIAPSKDASASTLCGGTRSFELDGGELKEGLLLIALSLSDDSCVELGADIGDLTTIFCGKLPLLSTEHDSYVTDSVDRFIKAVGPKILALSKIQS